MRPRRAIAESAAEILAGVTDARMRSVRALIGFDGFVDSIIRPVGRRRSMAEDDFDAITTISAFAERCASAAGKSANIEMHVEERRFGGNGPLMAGAMGRLGAGVTYIGAVGQADAPHSLNPIYEPFAARCERVVPVAASAETDALEFDDGKLMLGKPANVQVVDWPHLKRVVGLDTLRHEAESARTIAVVNWVMMAGVESIWLGLLEEVLPAIPEDPERSIFVDLCDPAKRTDDDIRRAMAILRELDRRCPVTLGLNRAEAERIAVVLGVDGVAGTSDEPLGTVMQRAAGSIRDAAGLRCCVVHPREGAAASTADESAWFEGPFVPRPVISTGAGDHFNGGFALARSLGAGLEESLAIACATSGAYVRDAVSPDRPRLISFLRDLPRAESD
ncbi:MAG: PfkB family carbohydrate kinase [Phycisphaerales bacterium]